MPCCRSCRCGTRVNTLCFLFADCPAGSECSGTGNTGVGTTCVAGTYSNSKASTCSSCTPGRYGGCVNAVCLPELCPALRFCNRCTPCGRWSGAAGAVTCDDCGSVDKYCPGSDQSSQTDVQSGFYTTGGTEITRTGQAECEAGYYCSGGVKLDCGAVDKFCPGTQQTSPTTAQAGFYTTGGTEATRTGETQCEAGHYCSGGVKVQCPAGTFGNSPGLSTAACDGPCPAGYYCPAGTAGPLDCGDATLCVQHGCAVRGCVLPLTAPHRAAQVLPRRRWRTLGCAGRLLHHPPRRRSSQPRIGGPVRGRLLLPQRCPLRVWRVPVVRGWRFVSYRCQARRVLNANLRARYST